MIRFPTAQSKRSITVPSGQTYPQNPRGMKTQMSRMIPAAVSDQTQLFAAIAVERPTSGSMMRNVSASTTSFASRWAV